MLVAIITLEEKAILEKLDYKTGAKFTPGLSVDGNLYITHEQAGLCSAIETKYLKNLPLCELLPDEKIKDLRIEEIKK